MRGDNKPLLARGRVIQEDSIDIAQRYAVPLARIHASLVWFGKSITFAAHLTSTVMYAIVEIAGQQFKVQQDQQIFVHRLEADVNTNLSFDKVLLVDNGGKISVGAPIVSGAKVSAKVLDHVKGDKVIVFKKKRRKGYQKSNGHRQQFTKIQITSIQS
jgi:large subunit ribosomal protein L21